MYAEIVNDFEHKLKSNNGSGSNIIVLWKSNCMMVMYLEYMLHTIEDYFDKIKCINFSANCIIYAKRNGNYSCWDEQSDAAKILEIIKN
jgi:hypothetical protein